MWVFLFVVLVLPFFYYWLDKPVRDTQRKIQEREADKWAARNINA